MVKRWPAHIHFRKPSTQLHPPAYDCGFYAGEDDHWNTHSITASFQHEWPVFLSIKFTMASAASLWRCCLQGVLGAVLELRTVFNHKQLYRWFALRSITLQSSHPNPTWLQPTLSKLWRCGNCGRQSLIFQGFHNGDNSPKPSVQLFAQQQQQQC